MKTQCPHCDQHYEVDDRIGGEIVKCEMCGQEFVAEPLPEVRPKPAPAAVVPKPVPKPAAPGQVLNSNPNLMFCPDCGRQISRNAPACPNCGRRNVIGEDRLSVWIIVLMWVLLLIPCGSFAVVLVSSILYYIWRRDYPKKAKAVNLHGWLVFLAGILIWMFLYNVLQTR